VVKKFTHTRKFYEAAVPIFNSAMLFGDQMILN